MSEALISTLKWAISISFFIFGINCLRIVTDEGNIAPLMLVVLSFGVVYWLSKATYEASKKVFLTGFILVLAIGLLSHLFLWDIINYYYPSLGFYTTWDLLTLIIGIPLMTRAYWKEG